MNLYEQQSTNNPNMPVRLLQYAGNLYEKYFKENSLNKYDGRLLQLPVPKLVVFYNGKKEQPDSFVIESFLELHRTELKGMLLNEYKEAKAMELFREEGRAEGREEGRSEGIIDTLISLVQKGLMSIKDAAAQLGITEAAFQQKMLGK